MSSSIAFILHLLVEIANLGRFVWTFNFPKKLGGRCLYFSFDLSDEMETKKKCNIRIYDSYSGTYVQKFVLKKKEQKYLVMILKIWIKRQKAKNSRSVGDVALRHEINMVLMDIQSTESLYYLERKGQRLATYQPEYSKYYSRYRYNKYNATMCCGIDWDGLDEQYHVGNLRLHNSIEPTPEILSDLQLYLRLVNRFTDVDVKEEYAEFISQWAKKLYKPWIAFDNENKRMEIIENYSL